MNLYILDIQGRVLQCRSMHSGLKKSLRAPFVKVSATPGNSKGEILRRKETEFKLINAESIKIQSHFLYIGVKILTTHRGYKMKINIL